eukprot:CAMPEP_0113587312 /NCGR_PEP_ID=MMETSP0015_2-20120614/34822_1 /TAXON_ID=2838 /ORGANISM="Odontella" /LENGTH=54 /DNA_ID=CAMNT_0000492925 /DNA_START=8 /DNA_END=169 /DNA_ORIENTATION=- /assembly_acc=CAM_ASM_000160
MAETPRHSDAGAAAADESYSNINRTHGSRGKSRLFHMRNFNNWVKLVQIGELDP